MARILGPKCRLCRREGMKLFLKGERCHGMKCAIAKRGANYPPGMQGWKRPKKGSDYGAQLREKQRLKRMFGMLDRQFRRTFAEAERDRGNTGTMLLQFVTRRLDNVVRLAGFGYGPSSARQIVAHGLCRLNGRRVDRPSMLVKPGDVVSFTAKEKPRALIQKVLESSKAYQQVPAWLERDEANLTIKVLNVPSREEFPFEIRERLIVEGSSK